MATVYLVCLVALKVLHPELAATLGPERFLRQIKLAARLQHYRPPPYPGRTHPPRIPSVHGTSDSTPTSPQATLTELRR